MSEDWFSRVVNFFVKHNMLDAHDEYDISDVMAALHDNYAPETNDITQLSTLYSNAIARAEKAEEALRVAGWQTIETAPKDGSDVLLSAANWHGDVLVGCWSFNGWRDRYDADELAPTHWMPLPPPPVRETP